MKDDASDENHFGWTVTRHFSTDGNNTVTISATESKASDNLDKSDPVSFLHPPQCLVHGVMYPAICPEEKWSSMNSKVRYRHDDILVVSYPKCGTTWIEQCVLLILRDGDKSGLNPATKNVYSPAAPEKGGKIWLEACIDQDIQVLMKSYAKCEVHEIKS
jgi:Sulfotransferase domain